MKIITHTLLLSVCVPVTLMGATTFSGTTDSDFNNVANWDNGLPSNGGNDGTVSAPATMSANFNPATGISYHLIINSSLSTGANELQHRSGSNGRDVTVGGGAVGSLTINSGGRLDIAGAGSDLFIGVGGGSGVVTFENGSTIEVQKTIEVLSGSLNFGSAVSQTGSLQDEIVINDTLSFDFDPAFNHFTLSGQSLILELGLSSVLDLDFASAPDTGSTYTLVTDVSGFAGAGAFGSVVATGLGAGQSITVDYSTSNLFISVVPEPGSLLLLLSALPVLALRRR